MDMMEFQNFFDQSQDLIGIVDTDLRYVAANKELCRYWGFERDCVVGSNVKDIVGEAAFEGVLQRHMELCLLGKDVAYEAWVTFPAMGRRSIDVKYTPRRNINGDVVGIFIIARDKTFDRLMEEKVQMERDKLDEILASVNVGLILYNPDLSVSWINDELVKMFPDGDFRNMTCHEFFRGKTTACVDCPTRRTFETGEAHSSEVCLSDRGRWYSLTTEPVYNDEDTVVQVLGHVIDITERKQAKESIIESERRFRNIFENVDMIAVQGYGEDRRVVYWNPASVHLYGFTQEEAMGELLENLIIPEPMHDLVKAGHKSWVEGGPAIPASELELKNKAGDPVPVYSTHVMQETASGERVMYCVDVDLAEIKRIHNQLVRAKEEAEAANDAKSEFLANMSHEIRTPLNGIQGMLALMQATELDETQREYAQAGVESAKRLNRLLSDILDLSRVEAGKMVMENEVFSIHNLVQRIEELYKLSFDGSGVTLRCNVDPDVPTQLVGDSARLQQVLTNLVGNGLKYTDSGEVSLSVTRLSPVVEGKQRILFSVEDSGIGIGKDVLDALFEPFVQGSRGYARRYQGAGLGLSICKRLVDLMGGSMSVDSAKGEGSTFHLVLSLGDVCPETHTDVRVVEVDRLPTLRLNVLLAEDDRINSMVGVRLLEKLGCTVTAVANGKQAVEAVVEDQFDVIFMDVQMPEMDGVEATKAIRSGEAGASQRDIPIVALTAFTMAGDRERFLGHGMNAYIPKPVEMPDVVGVLREVAEV